MRIRCERVAQAPGCTLIRVNPREPQVRGAGISIAAGALATLQAIDARLSG